METVDKNKVGWTLIILSLGSGVFLFLNSSLLNPDNDLTIVATTLYKNILLFMLLNWIFVVGTILIKKEKWSPFTKYKKSWRTHTSFFCI